MPATIPADFPVEQPIGAVSGVQPKVTARRLADGTYTSGLTDDELLERYEACEDLSVQLAAYCDRKWRQNPSWSQAFSLDRTLRGLVQKANAGEWHVSPAEQAWIMTRVRAILGWPEF